MATSMKKSLTVQSIVDDKGFSLLHASLLFFNTQSYPLWHQGRKRFKGSKTWKGCISTASQGNGVR